MTSRNDLEGSAGGEHVAHGDGEDLDAARLQEIGVVARRGHVSVVLVERVAVGVAHGCARRKGLVKIIKKGGISQWWKGIKVQRDE